MATRRAAIVFGLAALATVFAACGGDSAIKSDDSRIALIEDAAARVGGSTERLTLPAGPAAVVGGDEREVLLFRPPGGGIPAIDSPGFIAAATSPWPLETPVIGVAIQGDARA